MKVYIAYLNVPVAGAGNYLARGNSPEECLLHAAAALKQSGMPDVRELLDPLPDPAIHAEEYDSQYGMMVGVVGSAPLVIRREWGNC